MNSPHNRRAAGVVPHEGIDVIMESTAEGTEVRPAANPRLAKVLRMERLVSILRHVGVAVAIEIDV